MAVVNEKTDNPSLDDSKMMDRGESFKMVTPSVMQLSSSVTNHNFMNFSRNNAEAKICE